MWTFLKNTFSSAAFVLSDDHKLADFESLNEQHITVSKTLAAQEINSTAMKKEFNDLTARYDTLREQLSFYEAMKKEFNGLTARYNTLRDWLSFYDAQSCNLSVNGWIACHGKLYFFSSDKLNWKSSRDVCVSKGADLVTITSQSEQRFLVSKINETRWIGLNDLDTEDHWVWVNKQTLTDTGLQFWCGNPKQPNNGRSGNCVSLGNYQDALLDSWFDDDCNSQKKFICEKVY
ncbi:hypothetical protein R3I94_018598 [Phoxinus phoxinus]